MLLGLCSRWDWKREQYRGPPRGDQSLWGVAKARKVPPYRVLSALMKCAQLQGRCPARPASLEQPRLLGS